MRPIEKTNNTRKETNQADVKGKRKGKHDEEAIKATATVKV